MSWEKMLNMKRNGGAQKTAKLFYDETNSKQVMMSKMKKMMKRRDWSN